MSQNLNLLIDFGSTYTKVTAVDLEQPRIIATGRAHTTITEDIMLGLAAAVEELQSKAGKALTFSRKVACSSAAGGLRMVAIGLVKDLTVEAAKRAALGAGARVLRVYAHQLSQQELLEIEELNPDIILLAGGTDGGNKQVILENAASLSSLKNLAPVIMAGNKSAVDEVKQIFSQVGKEVRVCDNVMPEFNQLNVDPARKAIRAVFLERIIHAKGLDKAEKYIEGVLLPTPASVLNAVTLLSKGNEQEAGIGDLLLIDIGGATTDVHSVAEGLPTRSGVSIKGLPEPFAKRTVEGDLGMRYSMPSLYQVAKGEAPGFAQIPLSEWEAYYRKTQATPDWLPETRADWQKETLMAQTATIAAVNRHVGTLEVVYTPFGPSYLQYGKDLTQLKTIIGTGGVIAEHPQPADILAQACFNSETPTILKPQEANFLVDEHYILAAMGLLSEIAPNKALQLMKANLKLARRDD